LKPNRRASPAGRLAGVLLACIGGGCVSADLPSELSRQLAQATGNAELLRLEIEGEPLDAPGPAGDTLTLAGAIRQSMAHSPDIQAALARVRAAQADALQARLLPNPLLRVVVRFPEGGMSPDIEAELAAELIDLLRRPGRVSAADSRLRAAASDAVSQALDVVADVEERYAAVQALEEHLRILGERLRIVERLLELARDRLALGEGTRLDVLTFEARVMELEAEVADRELEQEVERLALARLIGRPSGAIAWQLAVWEIRDDPRVEESRWIAVALQSRPEVQAKKYELEALGADLSLTRFAPFLDGSAGAEGERGDGAWAVGPTIAVPVPLFDFGQAKRQRAYAALIEARHDLTSLERLVVEEVRRAVASLAASRKNLERVRERLVPAAQLRYEQAEAQFRAGQTDVAGLLIAEEELHAARNRLVQVERRNAEAVFRLQRAVGGPGVVTELGQDVATASTPVPSDGVVPTKEDSR